MKLLKSSDSIEIPADVKVQIHARNIVVEGPRGKLTRSFKTTNVDIYLTGSKNNHKVVVDAWMSNRKQRACVQTVLSHIRNMVTGVTKGFEYKMRFVYAHFPISCNTVEDNTVLTINNFLGEKRVRRVKMAEGCKVERSAVKDEIIITGNDLENVGLSAALVHQSCLVKNKDIRKFLDGCYVSEKHVLGE